MGNQGNPRRRAVHRPHVVGGRQGRRLRRGERAGGSRGSLGAAIARCDSPPSGGPSDSYSSESPRRLATRADADLFPPGRSPRDGPRGRARVQSAHQRSRGHQENAPSSIERRKEARKALWSSGRSQKTPNGVIRDFHFCGTICGRTIINHCFDIYIGGGESTTLTKTIAATMPRTIPPTAIAIHFIVSWPLGGCFACGRARNPA